MGGGSDQLSGAVREAAGARALDGEWLVWAGTWRRWSEGGG